MHHTHYTAQICGRPRSASRFLPDRSGVVSGQIPRLSRSLLASGGSGPSVKQDIVQLRSLTKPIEDGGVPRWRRTGPRTWHSRSALPRLPRLGRQDHVESLQNHCDESERSGGLTRQRTEKSQCGGDTGIPGPARGIVVRGEAAWHEGTPNRYESPLPVAFAQRWPTAATRSWVGWHRGVEFGAESANCE